MKESKKAPAEEIQYTPQQQFYLMVGQSLREKPSLVTYRHKHKVGDKVSITLLDGVATES